MLRSITGVSFVPIPVVELEIWAYAIYSLFACFSPILISFYNFGSNYLKNANSDWLKIFRACSEHENLLLKRRFLKKSFWAKSYGPKPPKNRKFSFLVRKIHVWQNYVTVFILNVIQLMINNLTKSQCISMSITEVIKDTKLPKIVIFFVNHVSQKVLTSAPGDHVTLKFCTNVPR